MLDGFSCAALYTWPTRLGDEHMASSERSQVLLLKRSYLRTSSQAIQFSYHKGGVRRSGAMAVCTSALMEQSTTAPI
jgi:hypothetical protein